MLLKRHIFDSIGSGIFLNSGYFIGVIMFTYHWILGREFNYSRTLSTMALLNYLSHSSIYFLHISLTRFSNFISISFQVGDILKKEEFKKINSRVDKNGKDEISLNIVNASFSHSFIK